MVMARFISRPLLRLKPLATSPGWKPRRGKGIDWVARDEGGRLAQTRSLDPQVVVSLKIRHVDLGLKATANVAIFHA